MHGLNTWLRRRLRHSSVGMAALASGLLGLGALAAPALANAPQPTAIHIDSNVVNPNGTMTVTVSGTWTWDQRVPTGPQKDCNDQRSGVGFNMSWGDNTANPLKTGNTIIYVGDPNDNWVHSVSEDPATGGANMTFDGPFKPSPSTVTENMTGETADAAINGFGPQGIPDGVASAAPDKSQKYQWFSNCGPTAQSTVDGQLIGNSDPSDPVNGYPNGTWGPISHTYATAGTYRLCPVMYDPHAQKVGVAQTDPGQLTAGGAGANDDNSVQSNNNPTGCPLVSDVAPAQSAPAPAPAPGFEMIKEQRIGGRFTTRTLRGAVGQVVHYKIVVVNTGDTPLTFSDFTDSRCDSGTISGGPGSASVAPKSATVYTCSHRLTTADATNGRLTNVAVDTGTPPGGSPITNTSNRVVVAVVPNGHVRARHGRRRHARPRHVKARHISRAPRVSSGFTG